MSNIHILTLDCLIVIVTWPKCRHRPMDSGEFGTRRDESNCSENLSRWLTSLKQREVVTFLGGQRMNMKKILHIVCNDIDTSMKFDLFYSLKNKFPL